MTTKLVRMLAVFSLIFSLLPSNIVAAQTTLSDSGTALVISEIQTGGVGSGTAAEEFIEIYNRTNQDIDITGWTLKYSSYSDVSKTQIAKFNGLIKAHSFVLTATDKFVATGQVLVDEVLNDGLSATGGHVRLYDADNNEIDKIGWQNGTTTTTSPEGIAAPAPAGGHSLKRVVDADGQFIDSNNNFVDFVESDSPYPQSGGYFKPDIPDTDIPDEAAPPVTSPAVVEYPKVYVSELLPNPAGSDTATGKEFIELYNPNDISVDLTGYKLEVGVPYSGKKILPNFVVPAKQYLALYAGDTGLTLTNTSGQARITAPDDSWLNETDGYAAAGDDLSWALIDDVWQFTNQLTPNAANLGPVQVEEAEPTGGMGAELEACSEGKYRNPETNRCKTLESTAPLVPCAEGQQRSVETNRCRSIISLSSAPVACQAGQERNPETNRCRKIASEDGLQPCEPGQERNPDTNRCRKVTSAVLSSASPVNPATVNAVPGLAGSNWWIAGVVAAGVVGYGAYEWRAEAAALAGRLRSRFMKSGGSR